MKSIIRYFEITGTVKLHKMRIEVLEEGPSRCQMGPFRDGLWIRS